MKFLQLGRNWKAIDVSFKAASFKVGGVNIRTVENYLCFTGFHMSPKNPAICHKDHSKFVMLKCGANWLY